VSGGGKSEISKSLADAFVFGNAYAADFAADVQRVQELLDADYSDRFLDGDRNGKDRRPILSPERSLGSVIKLLTPRSEYTAEYNSFLRSIPAHVKELLFTVKRYYKPEWGTDWRSHFSVGIMNGRPGNAVRLEGEKILVNQLRVGVLPDNSWRLFSLRPDFSPAIKVQTEDDITASTVCSPFEKAPAGFGNQGGLPRKYVMNCEQLLFQRPDDAIHRGYDKQAERDLSKEGTFISNFEPLTHAEARDLMTNAQAFSEYTKPMQDLIRKVAAMGDDESLRDSGSPPISSLGGRKAFEESALSADPARRRQPERPPRQIWHRSWCASCRVRPSHRCRSMWWPPDDATTEGTGCAAAERLQPLHYMELPELFMEFISSMTGKSPSTTGAGSEGAVTKGPFNALAPIVDLNNNFLAYALTGYDGWLSSAGYIGPKVRVDHDISMLVPELFSRMWPDERRASNLIADGYLEKLEDFEFDGRRCCPRLGYRMNERFATTYFGRIFLHPDVVFTDDMLRPEQQDLATFAESMDVIVTHPSAVAQAYFNDAASSWLCRRCAACWRSWPRARPRRLDAGQPRVPRAVHPRVRARQRLYAARLDVKQAADVAHQQLGLDRLREFSAAPENEQVSQRLHLQDRIADAETDLAALIEAGYRESLVGTIGRQEKFD
jgi:hypothetical protein